MRQVHAPNEGPALAIRAESVPDLASVADHGPIGRNRAMGLAGGEVVREVPGRRPLLVACGLALGPEADVVGLSFSGLDPVPAASSATPTVGRFVIDRDHHGLA